MSEATDRPEDAPETPEIPEAVPEYAPELISGDAASSEADGESMSPVAETSGASAAQEVEPVALSLPPQAVPEGAAMPGAWQEEEELDLDQPSIPRPEDEVLVEAALFASTELLTLRQLRELVDPALSAAKVQKLVQGINQRLSDGKHPFEVVSSAGAWRLRTRPELYPWLRGLFKEQQSRRLSQAVLETLAVVAYKQPITKAEIEAVRGVSADGALKKLLEKRLVTVSGRTDTPGRPLTYGTTKEFLEYFGINKLPDDLPRLAEFEELVQARALLPQVAPGGVLVRAEQEDA